MLDLRGRLKLGEEDMQLRQRLRSLAKRGHAKVVANLNDVDAIDNTALGTLRLSSRDFQNRDGKLVLLNPPLTHLEPFTVLALETEFEIFDNEQEAVNSFFPSRASHRIDLLELIRGLHHSAQR